jgi:uridine monophosphate synthetase
VSVEPEPETSDLLAENARLRQRLAELDGVVRRLRAQRIQRLTPDEASSSAPGRSELAGVLLETGCVRFGRFTLKSGLVSPIYLDLRRLSSFPDALRTVALAYLPLLEPLAFDHLAAVPYTALPIGTALALATGRSLIYARREAKDHGTKASVEGVFRPGETAVVVDDVATTGLSTTETIDRLRSAGLNVRDVVVLIDRGQGAARALGAGGCRLHAVTTLRDLLAHWRAAGAVDDPQLAEILSTLDPASDRV